MWLTGGNAGWECCLCGPGTELQQWQTPTFCLFHGQKADRQEFSKEFLQLRRDRNAGKSDGSGHSVINLLRARGLSLVRSGRTASDMPRRLASPHDCPVHRAEKLFALSLFKRICILQAFHVSLESLRKCSDMSKKQVCVL